MVAISWSTIQSLAIFFGPIVLPRALAFYRSLRAPSTIQPQPIPTEASRALNILFISAVAFLLSTLPFFSPPNIFQQTASRLQTPTNVLFTRLAALRPLTPTEVSLRQIFESDGLEARLLYLLHGPTTLASCTLTTPQSHDAATTYLFYALPSILAPHLFHLLLLGLSTSAPLAGKDAARWRTGATILGVALAGLDVLAIATYEYGRNARATTAAEIDFFSWKARVVRGLLVAVADAALAWVIWMTATRRAFVVPKPAAERVEEVSRVLEGVLGKMRGSGAVRNVVFRDTALRDRVERYWVNEEGMMRSVLEEGEVVSALAGVLQGADVERMNKEAEGFVNSVLGQVQAVNENG
ncbi:hypothetical protein MBLNU457_g0418t1 [Dothideomycetes sp. NU457]